MWCPHCGSDNFKYKQRRNDANTNRFLCLGCGRMFSDKTAITDPKKLVDDFRLANVQIKKQNQKLQDSNRIERKGFREYARVENAVAEYNKELIEVLKTHSLTDFTIKHDDPGFKSCGIVHLSDIHFNELVSMSHNKYDFQVASKRLKRLANKAKRYFVANGIKNILIADTGDKLNSDRRLDELLNQATNRSNATILSAYLLQQFIIDLNQDFNISYACVTGNESRTKEEKGFSNIIATDNYDFTIYNILRMLFEDCEGVEFIVGNPSELVVNVAGQNVLLLHGDSKQITKRVEESVQKIVGKYALRGIIINFVIFGHVHSARIGDQYGRSSSMVGDNDYSDKELQLAGRASQNCHIIYENGNRDGIKIDLQFVDDIDGYDIIKQLEAYNAKSAEKARKHHVIFQVVT